MDVHALQQIDVPMEGAFQTGGDRVSLGHGYSPVHGDGQIDDDVRAEAMRLHFFDGQNAGHPGDRSLDLVSQFRRGDGIHQVP
jgi:type 1 glutamine amidotransferase